MGRMNNGNIVKSRDYLFNLRIERNLSQYEVAKRLGYPQFEYGKIENGTKGHLMNAIRLKALAQVFNVDVIYIVDEEAKYLEKIRELNHKERW